VEDVDSVRLHVDAPEAVSGEQGEVDVPFALGADDGGELGGFGEGVFVDLLGFGVEDEDFVGAELG
jgi:hypothetical protein